MMLCSTSPFNLVSKKKSSSGNLNEYASFFRVIGLQDGSPRHVGESGFDDAITKSESRLINQGGSRRISGRLFSNTFLPIEIPNYAVFPQQFVSHFPMFVRFKHARNTDNLRSQSTKNAVNAVVALSSGA